jgi:hypothetical protein
MGFLRQSRSGRRVGRVSQRVDGVKDVRVEWGVASIRIALVLSIVASACRDSPSQSPSPSPTAPGASAGATGGAITTGVVVDTVSRTPVSGALIEFASGSARSDGAGAFQLAAGGGVLTVTVSAAGHVTRRTNLSAGTGAGVELDVIETGSLWSLDFYRELARNGAGGGSLLPLNPWTAEPRVYVDRRPESGSGRAIPDASVETVRVAVSEVLPLLTGGRLSGNDVEIGTEPPADKTPGTVVIRWDPVGIASSAGTASGITEGVGGNASVVILRSIEETGVIYHELGHVLGLYHPLGGYRPSLMSGSGKTAPPFFTDWDVFHANVLYARPPGNSDVDNDPAGFLVGARPSRTSRASSVVVVCRLP